MPKIIHSIFTSDITLAVWFMDDGGRGGNLQALIYGCELLFRGGNFTVLFVYKLQNLRQKPLQPVVFLIVAGSSNTYLV